MTQQLNMINSGNFKKFSVTEMSRMRRDKAGAQAKEAGKGCGGGCVCHTVDEWSPSWNAHTTEDAQDNPLGNMRTSILFYLYPNNYAHIKLY